MVMNICVRSVAVAALVLLVSACADWPTAPSSTFLPRRPPPPAPPPVAFVPTFPAISRPGQIFVAVDWPRSSYHGSPLASRYVLYDDGTFALQSSSANFPFFEYPGTYKNVDGAITFYFHWDRGFIAEGAWGTLTGDTLTVEYEVRMQHADFLDGVYVRTQ